MTSPLCIAQPDMRKCVYWAVAFVLLLLRADHIENSFSYIVAFLEMFTEPLPGKILIKSVAIYVYILVSICHRRRPLYQWALPYFLCSPCNVVIVGANFDVVGVNFKFIQAIELIFIGEVSFFRLLVDAPNLSGVFIGTSRKIMGYFKLNHDHFLPHFLQLVIR
jgi:hypothetical protein